jgi:hypothetical protein
VEEEKWGSVEGFLKISESMMGFHEAIKRSSNLFRSKPITTAAISLEVPVYLLYVFSLTSNKYTD